MNHAPGKSAACLVPGLFAAFALAVVAVAPALAQNTYQPGLVPSGPLQAPGSYGFRPQPESNARGRAPRPVPPVGGPYGMPGPGQRPGMPGYEYGRQWPYGRAPGAAQPAAQAVPTAPYLEVSIDSSKAWVQQTLLLTLSVISDSNISTVHARLPSSDAVMFRALGDPTAEARVRDGVREIVNRLHYAVMPLKAGRIETGPIHVEGAFSGGRRFTTPDAESLQLDIAAPVAGVSPWLPIEELELNARLIEGEPSDQAGPVTLVIEQSATGASGSQLPSPEDQLRTGELRLYRESTETSGTIDPKDGKLYGKRTDTFTLVPQKDAAMQVPTLRFNWWNTRYARQEVAILPGRVLNAAAGFGGSVYERFKEDRFTDSASWAFWLPLALIAFVTGMYWTWIWARGKKIGAHVRRELDFILDPMARRLRALSTKISPRRHLHVARRRFANSLPRSYRLWFCVRAADDEDDPDDWGQVLRFLVQRRLGMPAQVPMPQLAELIIHLHPGADPERVRQLLGTLDAAVYGGADLGDFGRWKKAFKHEIRPRILPGLWVRLRRRQAPGLPQLNP